MSGEKEALVFRSLPFISPFSGDALTGCCFLRISSSESSRKLRGIARATPMGTAASIDDRSYRVRERGSGRQHDASTEQRCIRLLEESSSAALLTNEYLHMCV